MSTRPTLPRYEVVSEPPRPTIPSELLSREWGERVRAASNRAFRNAAKLVALMAREHREARYVEGWACKAAVGVPEWHAWVEAPREDGTWMRLDPTPMWRGLIGQSCYAPVVEVPADELAPLVDALLVPRGKAACQLPIGPDDLTWTGLVRRDEQHARLARMQQELTTQIFADGQSELDRYDAFKLRPK